MIIKVFILLIIMVLFFIGGLAALHVVTCESPTPAVCQPYNKVVLDDRGNIIEYVDEYWNDNGVITIS